MFLFQRGRANAPTSQLKKVTIHGKKKNYRVKIPKNELFRIKKIFSRHAYAIPKDFLTNRTLIVVDVGANVGLFALYMKLIRPESIIYCFEPVPTTLELLQANIGYMSDFHIYPFAYTGTRRLPWRCILSIPGRTLLNSHSPTNPKKSISCFVMLPLKQWNAYNFIRLIS
jgi:hypothetical protein